jgi:hypothetical protein
MSKLEILRVPCLVLFKMAARPPRRGLTEDLPADSLIALGDTQILLHSAITGENSVISYDRATTTIAMIQEELARVYGIPERSLDLFLISSKTLSLDRTAEAAVAGRTAKIALLATYRRDWSRHAWQSLPELDVMSFGSRYSEFTLSVFDTAMSGFVGIEPTAGADTPMRIVAEALAPRYGVAPEEVRLFKLLTEELTPTTELDYYHHRYTERRGERQESLLRNSQGGIKKLDLIAFVDGFRPPWLD